MQSILPFWISHESHSSLIYTDFMEIHWILEIVKIQLNICYHCWIWHEIRYITIIIEKKFQFTLFFSENHQVWWRAKGFYIIFEIFLSWGMTYKFLLKLIISSIRSLDTKIWSSYLSLKFENGSAYRFCFFFMKLCPNSCGRTIRINEY